MAAEESKVLSLHKTVLLPPSPPFLGYQGGSVFVPFPVPLLRLPAVLQGQQGAVVDVETSP